MIEVGQKLEQTIEVKKEHTAKALGSGNLDVLSTPYMIACMENTALKVIAPTLEVGQESVGIAIDTKHLKASKIGETITYIAIITAVDGRKISYTIEAKNEADTIIGTCTHDRFIVDAERFMGSL